MTGPLYMLGGFSYATSLWIALGIGILFGFVLERAGFGDSRNLTNIFYFRDMRVLQVMFTAIVTALVGLLILSWVGLFNYSALLQYSLLKTYFWPQLVGGLLMGTGFIVGGFCPGTSVVGMMSAKLDALVFFLGMVSGMWIFAAGFPLWEGFYKSSDMGRITLWQYFGVRPEWMALAIVIMALAAFALGNLATKWAPYDGK